MISKELLSEVLGVVLQTSTDFETSYSSVWDNLEICLHGTNLSYIKASSTKGKNPIKRYINIHELASKCKRWALKEKLYILASFQLNTKAICEIQPFEDVENRIKCYAKTEHEAIFKACQWILENKDKDDNKDSN